MSWAVGFDQDWGRWIGYGVPATCDYPGCGKSIDRGLAYVCGSDPYGGANGCGLYFCMDHLVYAMVEDTFVNEPIEVCMRCAEGESPFDPTPDTREWAEHILSDESWEEWRSENKERVRDYRMLIWRYDLKDAIERLGGQ